MARWSLRCCPCESLPTGVCRDCFSSRAVAAKGRGFTLS